MKMLQWMTSSQVLLYYAIGRRSQTKMAVGRRKKVLFYLRYSRADCNTKANQTLILTADYSPFRRWTCGRIINTYPTYQPTVNLFYPPFARNESGNVRLNWMGFERIDRRTIYILRLDPCWRLFFSTNFSIQEISGELNLLTIFTPFC